jgi:hypothetical protein
LKKSLTWVVLCHSFWKIGSDFFWWQGRGIVWHVMPFERTDLYNQIESDIKPALLDKPNTVTLFKIFKRPSFKNHVLQKIPRQGTVSATQDKLIAV